MQIQADTALLDATRRIVPVIREYANQAERERRLSAPVVKALRDAGLLRICTPRSLGGTETDPLTRALIVEEVSAHDTAVGWTLTNPLDWAYLCARLPDAGAEEVYSRGPDALIAGQFGKPMQAVASSGGYRISGRSPLVSNCYEADWIATTAAVAGTSDVVVAYLPRESYEVIDTWHALGMRGTGSHDVAIKDVFVPKSRTFPLVPEYATGSHYQAPLYRFPLVGIIASNLPQLSLAVARSAIDETCALAQGKVPVASSTTLRERPSAQARLAEAEALLGAARAFLYDRLNEMWAATLAQTPISLRQKADMQLAVTYAVQSALRATELAHGIAGTSGIYDHSPLERYFRDVHVLRHHALGSDLRYESVGKVFFGLAPDFPSLIF